VFVTIGIYNIPPGSSFTMKFVASIWSRRRRISFNQKRSIKL